MPGLVLLSFCLLSALGPADSSRLAVIQQAPDFSLTTQAGDTLGLSDLKGKVLLVSFVFTTCNGTCPATTHRMSQVQQADKLDRTMLASVGPDASATLASSSAAPRRSPTRLASGRPCNGLACVIKWRSTWA